VYLCRLAMDPVGSKRRCTGNLFEVGNYVMGTSIDKIIFIFIYRVSYKCAGFCFWSKECYDALLKR